MATKGRFQVEQQKNNGAKLRVVVVGAGIVGATIAFNLSLRNVEVTIVDSHQRRWSFRSFICVVEFFWEGASRLPSSQ